jgi:hypothetical protein
MSREGLLYQLHRTCIATPFKREATDLLVVSASPHATRGASR